MRRGKRAFTLIELMMVVSLISLLAAMAIPSAARARHNTEDTKTQTDLKVIYGAITMFQVAHGFQYPTSWDELQDYLSIPVDVLEQKYDLNTSL